MSAIEIHLKISNLSGLFFLQVQVNQFRMVRSSLRKCFGLIFFSLYKIEINK